MTQILFCIKTGSEFEFNHQFTESLKGSKEDQKNIERVSFVFRKFQQFQFLFSQFKMFKVSVAVLLFAVVANAYQPSYYADYYDNYWSNAESGIQKLSDAVVKDLDGNDVSLADTQGKCVLIINTGSGCGLTNANMNWLNRITKRFPELVVIAFRKQILRATNR